LSVALKNLITIERMPSGWRQENQMAVTTTAPQASPNGSMRPSSASRTDSERTRLETGDFLGWARSPRFRALRLPRGTGKLAGHDGPDTWQRDNLSAVRDRSMNPGHAAQIAIASGHRPGKSALVAWLRHACGHILADDSHDARLIQDYLGHRSIVSTMRYTQPSAKKFEAVVLAVKAGELRL
jgi:hypothetical protein